MASAANERSKKMQMQILLMPFFTTSHIGPFTDLAIRLATARPGVVEPTVAMTPANIPVVRSALERHGHVANSLVKIATYPFPVVDGLPPGVENLSAAGADGWRIDAAAINEALTRPAQEAILRDRAPDAVVNDFHFFWNIAVADELGVPCVTFGVIGCFSVVAMSLLGGAVRSGQEVAIPGFQAPEIRIPVTELPEYLRRPQRLDEFDPERASPAQARCFGVAFNTFVDMERQYCEMFMRVNSVKRGYLVGPVL